MKDLFLQNIVDQVKEAQIKLGYEKEIIRLYYPIEEMEDIIEDSFDINSFIKKYSESDNEGIGPLSITKLNKRLEVCVMPDGVEFIYKNIASPLFLTDFIDLFRKNHHLSLSDIKQIFEKYSTDYICIDMNDTEDFDYMLRFKDSTIDAYYYCIKFEMGHTIYHRFTKAAYLRNGWKNY